MTGNYDQHRERRDAHGRFAPGTAPGPGAPAGVGQRSGWNAKLRRAVSEHDFLAVVAKLVDAAKQGDVAAAKVLLDRLCGRVRQEPVDLPHALQLPAISTSSDVLSGWNRVMGAVGTGDLDTETAALVGTLLDSARKAIETVDLAKRVEELEGRLLGHPGGVG